jgi:hypothetical protein
MIIAICIISAYLIIAAIFLIAFNHYLKIPELPDKMKNLHRVLLQKNITTKEELQKYLIGKTAKIISKKHPNNYGKIGSQFVIEKVDNLHFDDENPHAQLKDFCNKIYFKDIELVGRKPKTELVTKLLHNVGASSLDQLSLIQNIFK